jgi:hypothetical protein
MSPENSISVEFDRGKIKASPSSLIEMNPEESNQSSREDSQRVSAIAILTNEVRASERGIILRWISETREAGTDQAVQSEFERRGKQKKSHKICKIVVCVYFLQKKSRTRALHRFPARESATNVYQPGLSPRD